MPVREVTVLAAGGTIAMAGADGAVPELDATGLVAAVPELDDPLSWLPLGAETANAYFLRPTVRTALGRSDEAFHDIRRALSLAPRSEIYRAEYHRLRSQRSQD